MVTGVSIQQTLALEQIPSQTLDTQVKAVTLRGECHQHILMDILKLSLEKVTPSHIILFILKIKMLHNFPSNSSILLS